MCRTGSSANIWICRTIKKNRIFQGVNKYTKSTYYTLSTQWYPFFRNANNYSIKSLKSIFIHKIKLIDMFHLVHKISKKKLSFFWLREVYRSTHWRLSFQPFSSTHLFHEAKNIIFPWKIISIIFPVHRKKMVHFQSLKAHRLVSTTEKWINMITALVTLPKMSRQNLLC